MSEFRPISPATAHRLLALWRRYFRPEFIGLNALDLGKPALFVGNHTRYGLLDVPLLIEHLYVHHGVLLRSLGDRDHFAVPFWRDVLSKGGMVLGTPDNCDVLMRAGESVLVFPGGAREVWRRKGEEYTLMWKERLGFVRQAIKHGYDIIPFGALGPDECYTVVADANDMLNLPGLRALIEHTALEKMLRRGDMIPPLGRGIGPTLLPRPQRFYFGFGTRIPTTHLKGEALDERAQRTLRESIAQAITQQITHLKAIREQDRPETWSWLRRRLTQPMSS